MKKTEALFFAVLSLLFLVLALICPAASHAQSGSGVIVLINGPNYDTPKNLYRGSFSVNTPSAIDYLLYTVEDADAGTVIIGNTQVVLGGFNSKSYELDGALFKPERKYLLKVHAIDHEGNYIPRSDDNRSSNPGDQYVLASKEFTHLPPAAPGLEFSINSANVDREAGQLILRLSVPGRFQVLKYDGFIVDETGQQVGVIPGALYSGPEVAAPLPEAIAEATEERKYKLTLRLFTKDDQQAERVYELTDVPPPPPGFLEQVGAALQRSPAIALAIVAVLSIVATALILITRRPSNTYVPPLGRPPQNENTMPNIAAVRRGRLHLRVVQSPSPSRGMERTITAFPCVIGRDEKCTIRINDPHVSRKHLEIAWEGGRFFVTDLNSTRGTFINDTRLRENAAVRITGTVSVRLGENTILDLDTGD